MKKILLYIATATLALSSCNKFLDELPDNRMELKNAEEVSSLLVNAYPQGWSAYLLEMYSDNTDECIRSSWTANDLFQEQAWSWADINQTSGNSTPQSLWDYYYSAIASANQALEFLEAQGDVSGYTNQLSEAYLCRAYNAFLLSQIFCQAYDPATASTDLGLPYPLGPEKKIGEQHQRGTMEEYYAKIEADIERGLKYAHNNYAIVKYHFNTSAAYAFACRFYLNYRKFDKAIACANKVLGDDPASKLRDWASFKVLSANAQIQPQDYIDSKKPCNLLLTACYSSWGVVAGPYMSGQKYSHNALISTMETLESSGPWGATSSTLGWRVFINNSLARHFARNISYEFEYTDIQAGIGYAHSTSADFTTDKVLIERAEANALAGNYQAAIDDMNTLLSKFQVSGKTTLTLDYIKEFYGALDYYDPRRPTAKKRLNTSLVTDSNIQEPVIQCLLHLKRILTIHEGLRMQDVKRYGITIYRRSVDENSNVLEIKDTMEARDNRLAVQIPQDVITAGLVPNPR